MYHSQISIEVFFHGTVDISVVEGEEVYFVVNFYTARNCNYSLWVELEISSRLKWFLQNVTYHTLYEFRFCKILKLMHISYFY
jgi:hypothetical protein